MKEHSIVIGWKRTWNFIGKCGAGAGKRCGSDCVRTWGPPLSDRKLERETWAAGAPQRMGMLTRGKRWKWRQINGLELLGQWAKLSAETGDARKDEREPVYEWEMRPLFFLPLPHFLPPPSLSHGLPLHTSRRCSETYFPDTNNSHFWELFSIIFSSFNRWHFYDYILYTYILK